MELEIELGKNFEMEITNGKRISKNCTLNDWLCLYIFFEFDEVIGYYAFSSSLTNDQVLGRY